VGSRGVDPKHVVEGMRDWKENGWQRLKVMIVGKKNAELWKQISSDLVSLSLCLVSSLFLPVTGPMRVRISKLFVCPLVGCPDIMMFVYFVLLLNSPNSVAVKGVKELLHFPSYIHLILQSFDTPSQRKVTE
jgi:hypothetical protein